MITADEAKQRTIEILDSYTTEEVLSDIYDKIEDAANHGLFDLIYLVDYSGKKNIILEDIIASLRDAGYMVHNPTGMGNLMISWRDEK